MKIALRVLTLCIGLLVLRTPEFSESMDFWYANDVNARVQPKVTGVRSQYVGYSLDRKLWWWEMVNVLRKIGFVAVVAVIENPFEQVSCVENCLLCDVILVHATGFNYRSVGNGPFPGTFALAPI